MAMTGDPEAPSKAASEPAPKAEQPEVVTSRFSWPAREGSPLEDVRPLIKEEKVPRHLYRIPELDELAEPGSLRGMKASRLLLGCGRLLASKEGGPLRYDLSFGTDRLDAYISHNWSTGRCEKFLALVFLFNWRLALRASALAVLVAAGLTWSGTLPTFEHQFKGGVFERGPWCTLFGVATFLVLLLFGQDTLAILGHRAFCSSTIFLDKTCIHQTDKELRLKGIQNLAGGLRDTQELFVIYTDEYAKRLWTVYEITVFLTLQRLHGGSMKRLRLMSTSMPKFVLVVMFQCLVFKLVWFIPHTAAVAHLPDYTWLVVMVATAAFFVRRWEQQLVNFLELLRTFSIDDAALSDEDDRALVYDNILHFMRRAGLMSHAADDKSVLDAFNTLVRTEIPQSIAEGLGHCGMSYKYIAWMMLPQVCGTMDKMLSDGSYFDEIYFIINRSIKQVTLAVMIWPTTVSIIFRLTKISLRNDFLESRWYISTPAIVFAAILIEAALWEVMDWLKNFSMRSFRGFLLTWLFIGILSCVTWCAFGPEMVLEEDRDARAVRRKQSRPQRPPSQVQIELVEPEAARGQPKRGHSRETE